MMSYTAGHVYEIFCLFIKALIFLLHSFANFVNDCRLKGKHKVID